MEKVQTNGIELAVYEWSNSGEPVIFLHFLTGNSMIWNGVVPSFTENYRAIGIDLRGHGMSDAPESGYEVSTMVEDVVGVLDALGIDSAHIVGSSLGCNVAVYLAAEYPERVRSLALSDGAINDACAPNGEPVSLDSILDLYKATPDREFDSVEGYIEFSRQFFGDNWNPLRERAVMEGSVPALQLLPSGKLTPKTSQAIQLKVISALYEIHHESLYARVKCPVMFLPAANHRFSAYKNEFVARVHTTLPAYCKSVIIPGTEHVMMFKFPAELSREVLDFHKEIASEIRA